MDEYKLPNILITGTPGVGKTSLAMLLTDSLNEQFATGGQGQFTYISIGSLVHEKKLYADWNEDFDVPEFDDEKVVHELSGVVNQGGCVLDFHSSYFIPQDWVNLVVLIRCDNTILYDRLHARGYTENKIKENIECEIMEVTSEEVRENFPEGKIIELRGEQVDDMERNIAVIIESLKIYVNK